MDRTYMVELSGAELDALIKTSGIGITNLGGKLARLPDGRLRSKTSAELTALECAQSSLLECLKEDNGF